MATTNAPGAGKMAIDQILVFYGRTVGFLLLYQNNNSSCVPSYMLQMEKAGYTIFGTPRPQSLSPKVVSIWKDYTLPFKITPPLTRQPLIKTGYANPLMDSYLKEALHSLQQKLASEKVKS